jgi:nicotinic acid mononucleotide adenylyltransferase
MKVSVGTAALLDYLHATYDYEFYFCLGGDSFIDLVQGKWQQHDRILNDLLLSKENEEHTTQRRLLVLYRATTTTTANNETEHEKQPLLIQQYAHELGVRLIHIHHLGNISSTQIRNCQNVQELQSSNQMILPQVLEYIQQHRLYSFCYS